MKSFSSVETHYHREGIFEKLMKLLREQGKQKITREDIAVVDEFHVRGSEVSVELAADAGFTVSTKVLDVGSGIGGPARMIASTYGCEVTGIDLTEEFTRTATLLSKEIGLQNLTTFVQGDALNMPFENESFDVVWTQHVQMNIENKGGFYSEIQRVLKKGGRFIYYDIFSKDQSDIHFPVPWASNVSLSFLITISEFDSILISEGLRKVNTKDQTVQAIEFFTKQVAKKPGENISNISIFHLMGDATAEKLSTLLKNIKEGKLELQSGTYEKI
ncbi:MAG: methyltransferase domain-containing protein [Bacteroidota bacterium]|nr:methyltransferase domain-containing protein [Bacteroidota bacterium]